MELEKFKNPSAIIFAALLSLGLIISSWIVTGGLIKISNKDNTIFVKGSAKQEIKSDLAMWRGYFSARAVTMTEAYQILNESMQKVKRHLVSKGIPENAITFSSISTVINYQMLDNGMQTNRIESYKLEQNAQISSKNVEKIATIAREATELINEGVDFQSGAPEYYYTKIADLKINMLAKAAQDARIRAEKIAASTGSEVGTLKSADMGVIQITPLYSTEVSDSGMNDTSSMMKEITAVVSCSFATK